ncbi:MAG: helix-turn-helix transcriptional regulator [Sphingomonadales bacterium]
MDDEIARAANAKKGSPFLNTDQAAHYVGLSRRTLEKMRTAGGGPRFRKHGRYVRYHIDDLDEWSAEHVKTSTSEPDRQRLAHPRSGGVRR